MPVGEDKKEPVSSFIERMDREGMDAIEQQDQKKFNDYLKMTENTICGWHPIGVFLAILQNAGLETKT